jgi:hypothetical protein
LRLKASMRDLPPRRSTKGLNATSPGCSWTVCAVTAIEVVDHLVDPVSKLRSIADCLKPGGFVFITTGNMAKAWPTESLVLRPDP